MSEIPTPTEQEVSAARAALDPLCRWWLRRRLDVPAVHNLLRAQQRMLDNWAETEAGSPDRNRLWRELHYAGDVLADLTYGGAPWWQRVGYWLRPYDGKADRRRWRWQPAQCQRDQETARQILAVMRARRPVSDTEGMRQYAPYPDELAALVATMRLTVHPFWQFSLDDLERDPAATHSGAAGGLTFRVLAETRDAYQRSAIHYFPVPAATFNRTSWQRWLLDRLLDIQRHEVCEGLLFDEQRPFAPTHGPGDDPYIIVQYASDEQRRTSFRGEVKP